MTQLAAYPMLLIGSGVWRGGADEAMIPGIQGRRHPKE